MRWPLVEGPIIRSGKYPEYFPDKARGIVRQAEGLIMANTVSDKKRVLFICTHNAARSQMAEGVLNALHGDRFDAFSAGTDPGMVNPFAVKVMSEIGLDISHHRSKGLAEFSNQNFDYVITVCDHARESCPIFLGGGKHLHKSFADPSALTGSDEDIVDGFRKIRDEIKAWIDRELLTDLRGK